MAKEESLLRRVVARRRDLRVAASLFLRDRRAGVAYARSTAEIDQLDDDADAYRSFVRKAAARGAGREVAAELPSALGRVPAVHRKALLGVLERSLSDPKALPMLIDVVPALYEDMPHAMVADFVAEGLRMYREHPPRAEAFLRRESEAGARRDEALRPGLALEEIQAVLLHYARAHCGDDVTLTAGTDARADGTGIVLPERVSRGDGSFLWYRVTTALLAGEIEFGTHTDPERVDRALGRLPDPALARRLFSAFEGHRVSSKVRDAYPGIDRDIRALDEDAPLPRNAVEQAIEAVRRRSLGLPIPAMVPGVAKAVDELARQLSRLSEQNATVDDSLAATAGGFVVLARLVPEKAEDRPRKEMERPSQAGDEWGSEGGESEGRFEAEEDDGSQESAPRHGVSREARDAYAEMEAWLDREEPVSGGRVERTRDAEDPTDPVAPGGTTAQPARGVTYPEWDSIIGDYRPSWVTVVTEPCPADEGGAAFADGVLRRHRSLIRRLRKGFEALKPELSPRPRSSLDGDDVDMDAAVDLHVARRMKVSTPERLYLRRNPVIRDVCSVFLVDLSSSTNEIANILGQRILDVEKEALICLAEALDALGDRYAIDGFSGYGRDHVAYYTAKEFDAPLDAEVRARVGALRWRMENRDGAAIRHATARLVRQPARTRLLWLLSDGRPLDCGCDRYHDRYAQRDTHRALLEARRAGIHPFCLTVDPRGSDYLAEMYGDAYLVVEQASQLVEVLPRIYRRLTR